MGMHGLDGASPGPLRPPHFPGSSLLSTRMIGALSPISGAALVDHMTAFESPIFESTAA